jgi:hypothetical protein
MKSKDQADSSHDKIYPEMSFEEDFNRALATAISMEEFTQRMYKRIEAWPWKEK